jgi:dipeptidyl aminopeptidase/acylaminoacyl peptidase
VILVRYLLLSLLLPSLLPSLLLSLLLWCSFSEDVLADNIDHFFAQHELRGVNISPSGQYLAIVKRQGEGFMVTVKDTHNKQSKLVFDYKALFNEDDGELAYLAWIDNRYLAMTIVEQIAPVADLADTTRSSDIYFVDTQTPAITKDTLIAIRTTGTLINPLPEVQGQFLYAKSAANSRVYKVNVAKLHTVGQKLGKTDRIDGGQFSRKNRVASVKGYARKWFTHQSEVTGALVWTKKTKLELMETRDSGESWVTIETLIDSDNKHFKSSDNGETAMPVRYAGEPNSYYAVVVGDGVPSALYHYNFQSGERSLVYQHASSDIYRVFTSYSNSKLLSVSVKAQGELQTVYFKDDYQNIESHLRSKGVKGYIAIVDSDLSENSHIVYNVASDNPGRYYIFNAKNKRLDKLGDVLPQLNGHLNSELVVGSVENDGLKIEYFLTRPAADTSTGYPLVLIPHGGPIGIMDHRLFDPVTQFLVSKNYAVLQVNYRGSAGYGKEFTESGRKEWGAGMLEDIVAVTDHVKKLPSIDSSRMCIAGASYGGYASLAIALKYPALFKCAASFAAVTDVQLYVSKLDANKGSIKWLTDYIGDAETEADRLKNISPVYAAQKLRVPLLMAHGLDDRVVDIEHFYRMQYALKRANVSYEEYLIEGMGHGFETPQQQIDLYGRLAKFLDRHIGAKR